MTPASKPKANRYCKTGLWGALCIVGLCFVTPALLGLLGLAFLRQYLDFYVLLPLFVVCLLLGLYGWSRGGKIVRQSRSLEARDRRGLRISS